ncbi:MAG: hypothetical protein A2W35_12245 [Chloroflexi bacterium RBG_16_57_11]|nr:MAG: hypothetical protein A2W35_12245 [Chloroflexi bacterium RBG_16_57_11]
MGAAIFGRMMTLHRFFIFALIAWLAAGCSLARPSRSQMVTPGQAPVHTNTLEPTKVDLVETGTAGKPTNTASPETPHRLVTANIAPTPTADLLACLPDDPGITGLVSWVIDGETFVIDIAGRQETVRLFGIDAVPLTEEITRSLLDRRVVRLVADEGSRDAQGRFLRYVLYLDGRFINDELLRSGAARLDQDAAGLACGSQFRSAEDFAVQAGLGIWGYPAVAALPTELQPTVSPSPPTVSPGSAMTPSVSPSFTPGTATTIAPPATLAPTGSPASPTNTLPPTVTAGPTSGVTPTRTATQPVATGTVVGTVVQIVHIFYNGLLDPYESDEYIEIKNFENTAVDLTDWFIFEDNNSEIFFFPDFSLPAGQSCRIYTYQVQADSCVQDSFRSYFEVWNNDADCGFLYDWDFEERSSFCYGEPP